jgi:hypothetical protein
VEGLLGFVLASFALAGSPGPNTLSLAAIGAAFGDVIHPSDGDLFGGFFKTAAKRMPGYCG